MAFQNQTELKSDTLTSRSHLTQPTSIAEIIDHTLLKPDATSEDIQRVCQEALQYQFAAVCINSSHIRLAAELLKGSKTRAIAVVGFPLGAGLTSSKSFETREAIRCGAQEIDMVIAIGALKEKNYAYVLEDIRQVVIASQSGAHPVLVKVILEVSSLNLEEKIIACSLAKAAGAHFVKTSTGFSGGGATLEDVALMRKVVGPEMGVKASGGIRTYEDAVKMIQAGANRLGTSAGIAIVQGISNPSSPLAPSKTSY